MKNAIGDGFAITLTATAKLTSGQPLVVGDLFGVVDQDAEIGDAFNLWINGLYRLDATAGGGEYAANAGDLAFYDEESGEITPVATEYYAGTFAEDKAASDTSAVVRLAIAAAVLGELIMAADAEQDYALGGKFRAEYDATRSYGDPATSYGAVGAHEFGPRFPDKAVINVCHMDVGTDPTDGAGDTATLALGVATDGAAAIRAAAAVGAGYSAGLSDTLMDGTAANAVKTTAEDRRLLATVAGAPLTGGRIVLSGDYYIGS